MGQTWPKVRIIHVRRYAAVFEVLIELSGNKSRGKGHQNQNDDEALFAMMSLDDIPYPAPFGPVIKKISDSCGAESDSNFDRHV